MKRALFLIKNIDEITEALKFLNCLKEKYPFIESDALYVRDVMKYDLFPTTVEGVGVQGTMNILMQEYKALENKNFLYFEEELKNKFKKVYTKDGETVEIVLEEMKSYDFIVVIKNETLSSTIKDLLKYKYKPMILLAKTDDEYKYNLDEILMLNDGGHRANKSLFAYFSLFGEHNISVLRANVKEIDKLKERFGDLCNIYDIIGDKDKIILEEIEKYKMIIMGDLKFSVFVEKLAGNVGLKVINASKSPIFMG